MMASALEGLERLLAKGKDSALLRFGLGNEHLKLGDAASAASRVFSIRASPRSRRFASPCVSWPEFSPCWMRAACLRSRRRTRPAWAS